MLSLAAKYSKFNQLQISDAEEIVQKFNEIFKDSFPEGGTLVDIGSGCGSVLAKVVAAKLTFTPEKYFGSDISSEMIKFAKEKHENKKIRFHHADVLGKPESLEEFGVAMGSVDVVTSLYCLHWVKDLRKAFSSIRKMLKPGGIFLCSLLTTHMVYDTQILLKNDPRYEKFMKSLIMPSMYSVEDPVGILEDIFDSLDFKIELLEHKRARFDYKTRKNYKDSMEPVIFPLSKMPEHVQKNFMEDIADHVEEVIESSDYRVPYEIIFIIVSKPEI